MPANAAMARSIKRGLGRASGIQEPWLLYQFLDILDVCGSRRCRRLSVVPSLRGVTRAGPFDHRAVHI